MFLVRGNDVSWRNNFLANWTLSMTVAAMMSLVVLILLGVMLHRTPVLSLQSRGCSANNISIRGGQVLGAGGTDGDEFQLRYSGAGYCTFNGYPLWQFKNSHGLTLTDGSGSFAADTLFGGGGPTFATAPVRLRTGSPVSTGFEFFYSTGTPAQNNNTSSCMADVGSLSMPLADGSGVITVQRIPVAALKMNMCLIGSNLRATPVEGTPWPLQTHETRPLPPLNVLTRLK